MQIRRIGRYQLLEIVGKGGQGTVYRGHDPSTGQIVAVKILAEAHSDGDFLERFQREASILASLEHPHVIKVFDHGEEEGRHYIVTEYVPENLARIIEQGDPLPTRRALTVAAQIASALAVTHENGVTHRDVKPANVLISDSGDVKLTDFGIATADVMNTVSTPDSTVGTPLYMSPEQIQSRDIDGRSDIYSLGCLLYQILTGKPPFEGESAYDIFNAHMNGEYEPLSSVIESCPEELDNLLSKALATTVNDRFQSADEFMDAIDKVTDQLTDTGDQTLATRVMPRTIRSLSRRNSIWKRKNTWVTGVAVVAVLAIIGFAASTMLGGGSAVGLATGVTDTTESSLVPQAPIIIPEEPELAANLPIAENVLFSSGPNPDYLYAQISIPAVADVGHLSNISASTRDLDGNEAKLNVASVKTDGLRAPLNVIFLRAMEITVDAGEVVTDTLPGIIEFQVKRQWIEESGIQKNDIGLYRFKDEWQILPTTHEGSFIGSEDLFYERFSAKTPGFSRFAIGLTLQTQDAQSIKPDSSKEAASPQQPPADSAIEPSNPQSANEFPTPTPLALVGLQATEVPTPEPTATPIPPTPIPAVVTPQASVEALPTQDPAPTATPIPPTQVPAPTRVPPTSTPTPSPTPIPTEKVKDGSLAQLSNRHHAFIEYPGDVDEWIFAPSASMIGKPVSISVMTDNQNSDGYLEFVSPSGNLIAEDDDSGSNMNPLISYLVLPETGVYTVRFMLLDGTYGGYHLLIEPVDPNLPTPTITSTPTRTATPTITPTPVVTPTITPTPTVAGGILSLGLTPDSDGAFCPGRIVIVNAVIGGIPSGIFDSRHYTTSGSGIGAVLHLDGTTTIGSASAPGCNFQVGDTIDISGSILKVAVVRATASPTPTVTPTVTPTPTPTPTSTPTVTAIPSPTPSPQANSGGGSFNETTDSNYQIENYYCDVTTLDHPIVDLCQVDGIVAATIVSGHINQLGDVDRFLINVEEGMLISTGTDVDVGGSNLDPMLEIWKLGGSRLHWDRYTTTNSNLDNATIAGFLIEQGGPHEIVIKASDWLQEGSNEFTGQYDLYISITDPNKVAWRSNSEDLETGGGWQHVSFGTSVNAALDKLGDIDDYHFDGSAGDTITVTFNKLESTFVAPLYPMIQIFPPSMNWYYSNTELQKSWDHECIHYGDHTMSSSVESLQCTLKESGAYTLRITTFNWESGFGPYKFVVDRAAAPTATPVPSPTPTMTPTPIPTTVVYPDILTVVDLGSKGYGGSYMINGSYNGQPMWTNFTCGNPGPYEHCHIFLYGADTWVIQPVTPSDEWQAGGYFDCSGLPWESCSPGWEGTEITVFGLFENSS